MEKEKNFKLKKPVIITIVAVIVAIIAVIVIVLCLTNKKAEEKEHVAKVVEKNGVKINKEEKIAKEHNYEKYKITDAKLTLEGMVYTFTLTVQNTTNEKLTGKMVKLSFLTENGKEIANFPVYIKDLDAKALTVIGVSDTNEEVINATDFKIGELPKEEPKPSPTPSSTPTSTPDPFKK